MNHYRILAALCCLAISVVTGLGATGKKISDYTETLTVGDAWLYEIAVPGVTNYKVTFGVIATNIIARGAGGVSIAILNTSSNALFVLETTRNGTTGTNATNFGYLIGANGTSYVNAAAVALTNAVALSSSNNVRVAAGTGTTVTSAGSGGVQTFTVNATGGVSSVAAPISSVQYNSNGVMQGSAGLIYTNGQLRVADVIWAGEGLSVISNSIVLRGGDTALLSWDNLGNMRWPSSGVVRFEDEFALNMNRIQLGGDTAAFPAIGRTNGDVIILGGNGAFDGTSTNRLRVPGGILVGNAGMLGTGDHVAIRADGLLMRTNITAGSGGGGAGSFAVNPNQFITNSQLNFKDGAVVTNLTAYGQLSAVTINAGLLNLTNALGSNVVRMGYQDLTNIIRRQTFFAPAGYMISNSTDGATFATEQSSAPTNRMSDRYTFSGTVTNVVGFDTVMPLNWDLSTVKVKLVTLSTNNVAARTVVWGISAAAIKSGSVFTNIAWGTEVTTTNTVSSAGGQELFTPATPALTVGNTPAAAGNHVYFRIRRLAGHPDDNDDGQQNLLGAWVQYGETMSEVSSW